MTSNRVSRLIHIIVHLGRDLTFANYLIGTKSRENKKSWELIVTQKYCATLRLFVPATFCFLILRDIKFPRLLVLKFCATISSTRLFVPATFRSNKVGFGIAPMVNHVSSLDKVQKLFPYVVYNISLQYFLQYYNYSFPNHCGCIDRHKFPNHNIEPEKIERELLRFLQCSLKKKSSEKLFLRVHQ